MVMTALILVAARPSMTHASVWVSPRPRPHRRTADGSGSATVYAVTIKGDASQVQICAGLALWFTLTACGLTNTIRVGELKSETQSIDLGSISTARVQLEFPAGSLKVEGGASSLMEASFRYNISDWQPQVYYPPFVLDAPLPITQAVWAQAIVGLVLALILVLLYNADLQRVPGQELAYVKKGDAHENKLRIRATVFSTSIPHPDPAAQPGNSCFSIPSG